MPYGLSAPIQCVHFQEEAIVFGAPVILVMPISELHLDLNQLENEANNIFHAGGNIGVTFLFFLISRMVVVGCSDFDSSTS